ncbi:BolA family protein [Candidatus Albibeggiatoa sp. nov. NOAA]|uniref:BolA family protein n=1 Tax=Candidatus Albibeggiatoa sp. nov. NOAA TaxID=3162724 RepID=UPI0032FAE212|nr:BolA family transcriptional regulator [Thiotrichaceae bacterium]
MSERIQLIQDTITAALEPNHFEIVDNSAQHAGHAGAKNGGHFDVMIVSEKFAGLSMVKRHQLVYASVQHLMNTEIHALSIKAYTPEEQQ